MSGDVAGAEPSAELVARVASVAPSAKLVTLIVRRRAELAALCANVT
jgi:hypothetical protein